jgi:hypothetical protein
VVLDLDAPVLEYTYKGKQTQAKDSVYIRENTLIDIKAIDKSSGVASLSYQLDGKEIITYENPLTVDEEGPHELTILAKDQVNNPSERKITFFVDKSAPQLHTLFTTSSTGTKEIGGEQFVAYPKNTALHLVATDKYVFAEKIYYALNGAPEKLYTQPIFFGNKGETMQVAVRVTDVLGNEKTEVLKIYVE